MASGYLPVTKTASDVERCISCMKEHNLELDPNVETMLKTAIPQVKEYRLYTTTPFPGAQDARKVIDSTLPERVRPAKGSGAHKLRDVPGGSGFGMQYRRGI